MITRLVKISFLAALPMLLFPATIHCQDSATAARNQAKQQVETLDRTLREAVAVSKPLDDKDWFSQMMFAFPAGGTGTMGVNRTLYKADPTKGNLLDQLSFEFNFAKGGGPEADPRYLTFGLNFRKILLGSKRNEALTSLRTAAPSALHEAADAEAFRARATRVIREVEDLYRPQWFINYAGIHFETDLKKLKPGSVNNLLFAPSVEVRSRFMPIGHGCRLSRATDSESDTEASCLPGPFSWSYRFVPVGLELGKNLHNKDHREFEGDLISRLKTNANLQLFYRSPCRYDTWFAGILLEGDLTDRYLFRQESQFDKTTGLSNLIARHNQYALQVDLKIITGLKLPEDLGLLKPFKKFKLPRLGRRPAITFSYRRGAVPPVFSFYDKFRVGFTLATLEDDNARDLGHILPAP